MEVVSNVVGSFPENHRHFLFVPNAGTKPLDNISFEIAVDSALLHIHPTKPESPFAVVEEVIKREEAAGRIWKFWKCEDASALTAQNYEEQPVIMVSYRETRVDEFVRSRFRNMYENNSTRELKKEYQNLKRRRTAQIEDTLVMEEHIAVPPFELESETNTPVEEHARLRAAINELTTPEECRDFFDSVPMQKCLNNLRVAQRQYAERMPRECNPILVRETWAKKWAQAQNSTGWVQKQALAYNHDRKTCFVLLKKICDICFEEPNVESELPSIKDNQGLVRIFRKRRLDTLTGRCLPMDRANALYFMVDKLDNLYACWYGQHHVTPVDSPRLQNKRYRWLLETPGLNLRAPVYESWLEPVDLRFDDIDDALMSGLEV